MTLCHTKTSSGCHLSCFKSWSRDSALRSRGRGVDERAPQSRTQVTLRHLASGDSYSTRQYAFRVARSTINKFVPEVCDAIIRAYQDEVMTCPTSPENWLVVESVFCWRWNIPHALGALNGKYIPIRCPRRGGSLLYSWPWWMEIQKFLWVDLGAAGSSSDAQNFKHSDLRHKIEDGTISFPESESLVDDGPKVNYFILGNDAFPLKLWLMKLYSRWGMDLNQRVFNYRLSRGRMVVENAFRILTYPDLPEADAAGAPRGGQGGHSLPRTPQPAEDAKHHRSTRWLWSRGPGPDSAGGH